MCIQKFFTPVPDRYKLYSPFGEAMSFLDAAGSCPHYISIYTPSQVDPPSYTPHYAPTPSIEMCR